MQWQCSLACDQIEFVGVSNLKQMQMYRSMTKAESERDRECTGTWNTFDGFAVTYSNIVIFSIWFGRVVAPMQSKILPLMCRRNPGECKTKRIIITERKIHDEPKRMKTKCAQHRSFSNKNNKTKQHQKQLASFLPYFWFWISHSLRLSLSCLFFAIALFGAGKRHTPKIEEKKNNEITIIRVYQFHGVIHLHPVERTTKKNLFCPNMCVSAFMNIYLRHLLHTIVCLHVVRTTHIRP